MQTGILPDIWEWIQQYEPLLWWVGSLSLFLFIFTLVAIPWVIVRIPEDFFSQDKPVMRSWKARHPTAEVFLTAIKNVAGIIFIIAGIIMLMIPGQGILTILIGLMLLNFPGKHHLIRRIVSQRIVIRTVNVLRRRAGKKPIH